VTEDRRRDLCDLFAAVTLDAVDHHGPETAAGNAPQALGHEGATSHEDGAECPRCPRILRFEDDILIGLVYEVCDCGYVALLSPARALARYQEDQRRLARACKPFRAPPQHQGVRRVTVTCSLAA
jgi:hypothetical protein